MNKPKKCKNCQWYGKPYWSIINPCDSCPNENDYKTIIQIDGEPVFKETLTEEEIKKAMTDKSIFELTIEEKDKEIEKLNNIINELEKYINKEFYVVGDSPEGSFFEGYDTCLIEMKKEILDKLKELKENKEECIKN